MLKDSDEFSFDLDLPAPIPATINAESEAQRVFKQIYNMQNRLDCEVPFTTYNLLIGTGRKLFDELQTLARNSMIERKSKMMTDTDVADAFRQMRRPRSEDVIRRCIGDGAMICGAILIPYWKTHPLITFAGVGFVAIGLYVREFSRPK